MHVAAGRGDCGRRGPAWRRLLALGLVAGLAAAAVGLGPSPAAGAGMSPSGPAHSVAQVPRLVVLDQPYAEVWAATLRALGHYRLERSADGVIVIHRTERPPRGDEAGFTRVAERITVRVDGFGPGSTRIAVEVLAEGLRAGTWTAIPHTEATAREILARIRAAQG